MLKSLRSIFRPRAQTVLGHFGSCMIDLSTGIAVSNIGRSGTSGVQTYANDTTISNATTSVTVATSAGVFNLGSIRFYGVK